MSLALKSVINFISLLLLSALFYLWLKKTYARKFLSLKDRYLEVEEDYGLLLKETEKLELENSTLEKEVYVTTTLFDITKEICNYLDKEKLVTYFKEQLLRYLGIVDCRFIEPDINVSKFNGYMAVPLEIDNKPAGFLVAGGVRNEDKEKFYILSQQFILGIKRALLYQKVQELAITDSLTGILSRRYFLERFNEEINRSKKFSLNFSFLMVDIDRFKYYNDHFGHLVGDVILKEVSGAIRESIRQIDLAGKYGGDEFSLVLSQTSRLEAEFISERIRRTIENKVIRAYDENINVTVSIGISLYPAHAKNPEELIEKADSALYQAKQAGKNRVCLYG